MTIQFITEEYINRDTVKIVLSGGRTSTKRVCVRAIALQKNIMWQIESFVNKKAFHNNMSYELMLQWIADNYLMFRQINIINSDSSVQVLVSAKGKLNVSVDNNIAHTADTSHNRAKTYILAEGQDIAVLRELGIFTQDNQIVKAKMDKYKQINKFVEIIDHELKYYDQDSIVIADYGCGKSYLTFLVYYYFKYIRNINVTVYGYDIKEDVISQCNALADKFGYSGLSFVHADVARLDSINYNVDMIITLHACDTATDYALYYAIDHGVKYIFSVPCCQHEVNANIQCQGNMSVILSDGLIKERFSALLTDSIRCELLRQNGYSVDVLEFVDFAHSPKNLMIRAKKIKQGKQDYTKVDNILSCYHIKQKLHTLLTGGK